MAVWKSGLYMRCNCLVGTKLISIRYDACASFEELRHTCQTCSLPASCPQVDGVEETLSSRGTPSDTSALLFSHVLTCSHTSSEILDGNDLLFVH